jgi:uncharacterized protein YjbI with pentapeptide repeats
LIAFCLYNLLVIVFSISFRKIFNLYSLIASRGTSDMNAGDILKRYIQGERSFPKVDLREAELIDVNLSLVDFSQADLRCSRLGKTNFSQATFREADLSEAILWGTNLSEADFFRAVLREADLTGAKLTQACLEEANL